MILLIDNYDSFTYNIAQYLQMVGGDVCILKNDSQLIDFTPTHLVIGPGPGKPRDSGISKDLILQFLGKIPILGICLGHQCIGELYSGHVVRAKKAMHGVVSEIHHHGKDLFKGIKSPFLATRYHSLVVERASFPKDLIITGETKDGEIMALRHSKFPLFGVQFHPESVATEEGLKIFKNFIQL